jgi:hypothetical protein
VPPRLTRGGTETPRIVLRCLVSQQRGGFASIVGDERACLPRLGGEAVMTDTPSTARLGAEAFEAAREARNSTPSRRTTASLKPG